MPGNCGAGKNAADGLVRLVMRQRRCHGPRRFADDDSCAYPIVGECATRARARHEAYWIDGVNRRTENVVKIGSEPLKGTAQ